MAMFKSDDLKKSKQEIETIIGPSVKLEGDFACQGDVVVEGLVNGNIKTKNYLRVGETAQINAEIEASDAFIAGSIIGNIKIANKIEITGTARIKGDIETTLISIETGANINGKIIMKEVSTNKQVKSEEFDNKEI